MELRIDDEFRSKIPPLTQDEFNQLEENILSDGEVYEPIIVWNGTIVDGHNRWKIIQKHPEISYRIKEMDFADKWDAFDWMYRKQLGRRNLTETQRAYLIGRLYEARKNSIGNPNGRDEKGKYKSDPMGHVGEIKSKTRNQVAEDSGVSPHMVQNSYEFSRGADALKEVSQKAFDKVMDGSAKASKKAIGALRNADKEEVKKVATAIENNETITQPKGRPRVITERDRQLNEIVDNLHSEEVPVYTIDDLVEDVDCNMENMCDTIFKIIDVRTDVITCKEDGQRIADCMNKWMKKVANFIQEKVRG